jgi:circadian clock protein KaiB
MMNNGNKKKGNGKKKADKKKGLSPDKESEKDNQKYALRLYVTGQTPRSLRSIENLRNLCEKHLKGRYDLEVVDIYQQPSLAKEMQILAAPTLVKALPLPLRRLVGDFSDQSRVVLGLDLSLGRA